MLQVECVRAAKQQVGPKYINFIMNIHKHMYVYMYVCVCVCIAMFTHLFDNSQ